MRERWQQLANWIDMLSLRERGFLLLALIIAIFLIWNQVLLDPLEKQAKELQVKLKKQNKDLERLRARQKDVIDHSAADPNAQDNLEIMAIKKVVQTLDAQLQEMTIDLISPQQMAKVLEEVLTRETDLKLVSVQSLPPLALTEAEDDVAKNNKRGKSIVPGVYRHALKIEFKGSYLSTLRYMQELEKLSRRFYWGSVDFVVEDYPHARVTITVNTLSLNEAWIGV
ncbi:type II secretion system protein GspM [Sulfuriflexus mobilis]|uniref:type II secretion system protein GspM n=1 Tax=Sulfuriflexus mobilis TaxID=1811807 RepID=UPI000F82B5CD|nr:type II secretion system protein GspM [Sulfuriflexus mobilis]